MADTSLGTVALGFVASFTDNNTLHPSDTPLGVIDFTIPPPFAVEDLVADEIPDDPGTDLAPTPTQAADSGITLELFGRLDTRNPPLSFSGAGAPMLRSLAKTVVTVPDPAIINGRPWMPTWWFKPDNSMTLTQGVGHIRVKADAAPDDPDNDADWPAGGKPDYWWTINDLSTPPAGGSDLTTWPEHFGGPSWKSAGKYRPRLKRRVVYGEGGRKHTYTKAVHFDPNNVEHMWLDLGESIPQPYTIMMVGIINHYPTRRYGHYLMDAGRKSPSKDTKRDWQINDNLSYRNVMLFQLHSGLICTRHVVEDGVYARVTHNYQPRPRVFTGIFDGTHSYVGYHDPKDKHLSKGRTDNNSIRHLVMGRRQGFISDNYASHMTLFEVRMWTKALTPKQVNAQYRQIASTYKFSLYSKKGRS